MPGRCSRSVCTLFLWALLAAAAAGCGGGSSGGNRAHKAEVAAVIKGLDNPFFQTMQEGLRATALRYRTPLRVSAAAGLQDTTGQASTLESLVARDAGCYVVNPISSANLIASLAHIPNGTPIVNIDSPVDRAAARAAGVGIRTYIGTDNVAAGRLAATAMSGFVGPRAEVAVIAGIPGDATSDARTRGFLHGAGGHFSVIRTVAADFDRQRAQLAAEDLLRTELRLRGLFAVNDEMALGAARAVQASGRQATVAVIGLDGIREALYAVRRGAVSATVAQYPYAIGQLGVEACLAAVRNKPLPAQIDAPIQLVTGANVAQALARFPKPVSAFRDPLAALLGR
jgi:ABC-type sugar transport system substrate-binding protein